jgi:hypothetical protein
VGVTTDTLSYGPELGELGVETAVGDWRSAAANLEVSFHSSSLIQDHRGRLSADPWDVVYICIGMRADCLTHTALESPDQK